MGSGREKSLPVNCRLPVRRRPEYHALHGDPQAWYFIDKAVEGVLRDCLRDLLENPPIPLKYMGLKKLTLETLTLGGAPPTCGGAARRSVVSVGVCR